MKRLLPVLMGFALLLLSSTEGWSADFQKGLDAYNKKDYATALREWEPLAQQGNADAQYNLGVMYEKGLGVPQDNKTAMKWYRLSAEQGHAGAQFNLGLMYRKGEGVLQDYKTAVKWCKLAAEQGNATAQNNLGFMYDNGHGVAQDYVHAHMWFNIAASSGESKKASKNRDIIAKQLTPADISAAQKLARECVRKNYKAC